MHILVVDPNAGFAALLASELERLGHEVVTCGEGYEVYQAVGGVHPDLALVDAGLQEPDAYALISSLRTLSPEVRVLLIAAAGTEPGFGDAPVAIQGILLRPSFSQNCRSASRLRCPRHCPDLDRVGAVGRASDGPSTGAAADAGAGDRGRQVESAGGRTPAGDRLDLPASGDEQAVLMSDVGLEVPQCAGQRRRRRVASSPAGCSGCTRVSSSL